MGTDQHHAGTDMTEFVRWVSSLRTDVAETVSGVLLRGSRVVQVGVGGTRQPATSPTALMGFGLRNLDAANPATIYLRDSAGDEGAAGALVVPITLAPGASLSEHYGPGGLNLAHGLYADVAAGSVEGTVYLRGSDA